MRAGAVALVPLLASLALIPAHAGAEPLYETYSHRHALGGKIGLTGLGVEYSYAYTEFPTYGLRAAVNFGSYSRSFTRAGFSFDGEVKFNSVMLLADGHPYRNGFRASAGLLINTNRIVADGRPIDPTVTINDVTYTAAEVGTASGEVRFQWPSPYFGIGWGAAPTGTAGVFFSADFGVAYQRSTVSLNVACGVTANCAQLQADVRAQEAKWQEDLAGYRIYPILNIGVGYKF